ncbi:hypothetical protein SLA_4127 [Streptomyces laurentii]|uniref:Uncharacterized protein n=1 Tax=Streptomyces laurentii TaxID=39478 RepID=A0A160P2Q3_STRLU|nr:hypothetical protein SLA_4127 [Streptomyces laurentii]
MRAATVFTLSAGLALPALATAPAAYAIDTITRVTTSDDGRPVVELTSNALWVKVSVLASTAPDAAVLASTDDLSWQSADEATDRSYGWTTAEGLKLPEGTRLGDYPVVVEYRLSSGTVQKWTGGTYSHKLHTGVSKLSFDHKKTSYDDRNVVLSGQATTWDPSTGERTPAREGTKIKVSLELFDFDWRYVDLTATTGADGTFSLPFTPNASIRRGKATVVEPAADTDPDAGRPVPEVGVETTTYRVNAGQNKYRVAKNTDVTMSGMVQRLTPDGWKPFSGIPVVTANTEPNRSTTVTGQMGTGTTAADGSFKYGARATYATQIYTFPRPSVYFSDTAYDQGEIAVPQPITYSGVNITMDEFGKVRATARVNGGDCRDEPVHLQVSFDSGRTWSKLKYGTMQWDNSFSYCKIDVSTWGYVSAMYRLHHYETDRFALKDSGAVKLARIETRFSAFSVSPSRPRVNSYMTVTGTVQKKTGGTWKALSGAKVTLLFRPKGDSNWYWVTRNVPTDSAGRFSFKAKNYGDGTWGMVKQTQTGYFYSESKEKYIDAI